MKILLVSTLKRKVTSDNFASRSRIIYQLAEGLVNKGHDVSLLGTADSKIPGVKIIPVIEKGWVDLPKAENEFLRNTAFLMELTKKIIEVQGDFDVIHNHTYPDFFPSIIEDKLQIPMVTTLHALYDNYMDDILSLYKNVNYVALSEGYKKKYKKGKIYDVVYNGVDTDLYSYKEKKDDYLFWLGRMPKAKNKNGDFLDPKGVKWAIKLAQETGQKLKLYAAVEDRDFFIKDVKPHLNKDISWVGDVSAEQSLSIEQVVSLMQNAKAFLMTINQEEPFGLVMAEAMSCGTPVIAFDRGSVKEIVVDGKTGFVVDYHDGVDGLKAALKKIDTIHPLDCKRHVEENFSVKKMIENYESLYQGLVRK